MNVHSTVLLRVAGDLGSGRNRLMNAIVKVDCIGVGLAEEIQFRLIER